MNDIGLLLAHADTQEPVLAEGMPWEAAAHGPRSKMIERPQCYCYDGGDPDSLPVQQWGLVVPDGPVGDRLLASIDPLRKEREQQQGAPALIYRVPKDLGTEDAERWYEEVYHDENTDASERPRYLLILGDANLVSWDLQRTLAIDEFVGRLAFPSDAGYEAYVAKALAAGRAQPATGARALFYTARDGTQATAAGQAGLMVPTIDDVRALTAEGDLHAKEIVVLGDAECASPDDLLRAAAQPGPTVMLTISHGLGAPGGTGWRSLDEQRRFQGAMSLGGGQRITHEDVASRPFLPGGVWIFVGSLGAGMPGTSAYTPWLRKLQELGLLPGALDDVLRSLVASGQSPFVAALPQAALANPDGPLAVIGHADLAWTYSGQDHGPRGKKNRTSPFTNVCRSLVDGRKAGLGLSCLQGTFNMASDELSTIYAREDRAKKKNLPVDDDPALKMKKAYLWMLREDLSTYVLLGDPAVRLEVVAPHVHAHPQAVTTQAASSGATGMREDISAYALLGDPAVRLEVVAPHAHTHAPATTVASAASPLLVPAPRAVQQESRVKKLDDIEAMVEAILPVLAEDTTAKRVAEKLGVERSDGNC